MLNEKLSCVSLCVLLEINISSKFYYSCYFDVGVAVDEICNEWAAVDNSRSVEAMVNVFKECDYVIYKYNYILKWLSIGNEKRFLLWDFNPRPSDY